MKNKSQNLSLSRELSVYDCRSHLIWANEREVESKFERSEKSYSRGERVSCWLIQRGRVEIHEPDGSVSQAGRGMWLFPGEVTKGRHFSPRSRLISIQFFFNLLGGEPVFSHEKSMVFSSDEFPSLRQAAEKLVQAAGQKKPGEDMHIDVRQISLEKGLLLQAAFNEWLNGYVTVMRALDVPMARPQIRDERVARAMWLIGEHPMRVKFNEEELAARCGLSVNQLTRLFRRDTEQTLFGYYEDRRMTLACYALSESTQPLKSIAYDLGFGSPSHFTNWFSRLREQTPTAYRNEARKNKELTL